MNSIDQVRTLLEQRKEAMTAYEAATDALLGCDADSAEHYITQREGLASRIDGIHAEIDAVCAGAEDGETLRRTAHSDIGYDEIPEAMRPLYQLDQETRTIAFRVGQHNQAISGRLETFRAQAEEHIRNNPNVPKIKKYLDDLGDTPAPLHTDSKA